MIVLASSTGMAAPQLARPRLLQAALVYINAVLVERILGDTPGLTA